MARTINHLTQRDERLLTGPPATRRSRTPERSARPRPASFDAFTQVGAPIPAGRRSAEVGLSRLAWHREGRRSAGAACSPTGSRRSSPPPRPAWDPTSRSWASPSTWAGGGQGAPARPVGVVTVAAHTRPRRSRPRAGGSPGSPHTDARPGRPPGRRRARDASRRRWPTTAGPARRLRGPAGAGSVSDRDSEPVGDLWSGGHVLLVDDCSKSGWTPPVVTRLLRQTEATGGAPPRTGTTGLNGRHQDLTWNLCGGQVDTWAGR